jgi:Xaa-Pro aminopeptidase
MSSIQKDNPKNIEAFKVPASEIKQRTRNIQKQLQQHDIDGLFIVQRVDLFYFSGTSQNGILYIPAEGEPVLLIRQYLPRARTESSIKNIIQIKSIKEIPVLLNDIYGRLPAVLGFELDVLPVNDFYFYRSLMRAQKNIDASPSILKVRMKKSDWEIQQMEKTAELTRKTFEYMQKTIRPGLSEMEFAAMAETYARKLGHSGRIRARHYQTESYSWHIISGKNSARVGLLDAVASGEGTSAAFPVGAGNKKLKRHEPIMVDMALELNGYHLDETRMFAIDEMPQKTRDASEAAIEIHNAVLDKAKPGVAVDELFEHSIRIAESKGYAEPYLGTTDHKVTFIGHGIGLEIVEPAFIAKNKKEMLEPGMTFALEPKMTFENEFTAGVESVFVVTETGSRLITQIPVKVFVC